MPVIFEKKEIRKHGLIYIACGPDLLFVYKRGSLGWSVRWCDYIQSDGLPGGQNKGLVMEGCATRSAAIVQGEAALLERAGRDWINTEIEYRKGAYLK